MSLAQPTLHPNEITASHIVANATVTQVAIIGSDAATATVIAEIEATTVAATSIVRDATATGKSIERGDFLTALRETQNAYYAPATARASTVNADIHNSTAIALSPALQTGTAVAPFTAVAATWEANRPLVTAYWQGVTATAQALPTIYLTAAALEQSHSMTITAFPLDPLEVTATYIVGGATQTQAAYVTQTAVAQFGLSAPQPQLPSSLASVVAPISPEEIEVHRTEYINELISATGFRHAIFDEIVAKVLQARGISGRWAGDLELQVSMTLFADAKYVALVVNIDPRTILTDHFFLFRVAGEGVVLQRNPLPDINPNMGFINFSLGLSAFADVNNNNLPDLVIWSNGGGSCCPSQIHIVEIKEDGIIVDISPPDVDVVPSEFVDPDHDGQWEIIGVNRRGGASPTYYRWFDWNGTTYVDTSPDHQDFYQPTIDAFRLRLEQNPECYNPQDYELENILHSYVAMRTLKEGWAEIEPQLQWDTCTADQLKQFGTNMAYIEMWVKEHLK